MNFLRGIFGGSKKLSTVLFGVVVILLRDLVGLSDELAMTLANIIIGYLLGQAGVDIALALKGRKSS